MRWELPKNLTQCSKDHVQYGKGCHEIQQALNDQCFLFSQYRRVPRADKISYTEGCRALYWSTQVLWSLTYASCFSQKSESCRKVPSACRRLNIRESWGGSCGPSSISLIWSPHPVDLILPASTIEHLMQVFIESLDQLCIIELIVTVGHVDYYFCHFNHLYSPVPQVHPHDMLWVNTSSPAPSP